MKIRNFIEIAKPGIVFSNLFTAFTGFFLASGLNIPFACLIYSMLGISLVVASSTVLNNYIDRDIDKLMERTSKRSSVNGYLSGKIIFIYALILGILGFSILWFLVNQLTFIIVALGYLFYIFFYSLYFKRKNKYSTFIGSFAGATLPLAGYTSFSNNVDTFGIILFLILLIWQMPHFYAIAIFRLQDYKNANIPVMPVSTSIINTKIHIFIWTFLFFIVTLMPFVLGYLGWLYLIVAIGLGLSWLCVAYFGFKTSEDVRWSKKVFFFSILILMILCSVMMLDRVLIVV